MSVAPGRFKPKTPFKRSKPHPPVPPLPGSRPFGSSRHNIDEPSNKSPYERSAGGVIFEQTPRGTSIRPRSTSCPAPSWTPSSSTSTLSFSSPICRNWADEMDRVDDKKKQKQTDKLAHAITQQRLQDEEQEVEKEGLTQPGDHHGLNDYTYKPKVNFTIPDQQSHCVHEEFPREPETCYPTHSRYGKPFTAQFEVPQRIPAQTTDSSVAEHIKVKLVPVQHDDTRHTQSKYSPPPRQPPFPIPPVAPPFMMGDVFPNSIPFEALYAPTDFGPPYMPFNQLPPQRSSSPPAYNTFVPPHATYTPPFNMSPALQPPVDPLTAIPPLEHDIGGVDTSLWTNPVEPVSSTSPPKEKKPPAQPPETRRPEFQVPADGQQYIPEKEKELTDIIVKYMQSPAINPYKGSVPVERIQNIARSRHADLYSIVVGSKHNCWRHFVERHRDVFLLFTVEDGKWKMRLHDHAEWREGDEREMQERIRTEQHFVASLTEFLKAKPLCTCKIDEFMEQYPNLDLNNSNVEGKTFASPPLPARGDLVRFIRRHGHLFGYNDKNWEISLNDGQTKTE